MVGKILAAIGLALAFMGATLLNTAMARAETLDFELELPAGTSIDAGTMAGALIEAMASASDEQKPALVEALANVLRMNPDDVIQSPATAMAPQAGAGTAADGGDDQLAQADQADQAGTTGQDSDEDAAPADEGALSLDLAIVRRDGADDEILLQWL